MTDQQRFETTSLPLTACLLSQIPDAVLLNISSEPSIDGKRLLVIGYPSDQVGVVHELVEQFHGRRLVVPLYSYNKVLNAVRDRLKQGTGHHALR